MRRLITFLFLMSLFTPVLADGMMIPVYKPFSQVTAPDQKAIVIWDGFKETIILSSKIEMYENDSVAWVVPIKSSTVPEVSEGNINVFYDIAEYLSPPSRTPIYIGSYSLRSIFGLEDDSQVEVIEESKVDIYDIAILRATNATVLVDWLNENGYETPENAIPVLQYYADQDDFYFIANRINISNVYGDINFTANDRSCAVLLLSDYQHYRQYAPGYSYSSSVTPDDYLTAALGSGLLPSSCDVASWTAITLLFNLENGIATPLKIEFNPDGPFYPMKMTSVNSGRLNADVYFFSNSFFNDSSGIMNLRKMAMSSFEIAQELGLTSEFFLTSFNFNGYSTTLTEDSVFSVTLYDPSKDPYYVSLGELLAPVTLPILAGLIYGWLVIFLPLAAGYVVSWISRNKEREAKFVVFVAQIIVQICIIAISLFLFYLGGRSYSMNYITAPLMLSSIIMVPATAIGYIPRIFDWSLRRKLLAIILGIIILSWFTGFLFNPYTIIYF